MKRRSLPGPAPAGGPISCTDKKWGKEAAGGCAPLTPSAASGWPSAKVGGTLSRMSERAYSIPPAAAPRAQCLCRRVSGTVPEELPGRHGRFCVARSAHGEAENCAALPRTRARRANARNGALFSAVCPRRAFRQPLLGAPATRIVPTAGVPVGSGGSSRVLARYSRGFQRTRRRVLWRPSLVTFFDVKKVTRRRSTTGKLHRSPSGKI